MTREPPTPHIKLVHIFQLPDYTPDNEPKLRALRAHRNTDINRARAKAAGASHVRLANARNKLTVAPANADPARIAQLARAVAREADRLVALRRYRAFEEMLVETGEAQWDR